MQRTQKGMKYSYLQWQFISPSAGQPDSLCIYWDRDDVRGCRRAHTIAGNRHKPHHPNRWHLEALLRSSSHKSTHRIGCIDRHIRQQDEDYLCSSQQQAPDTAYTIQGGSFTHSDGFSPGYEFFGVDYFAYYCERAKKAETKYN